MAIGTLTAHARIHTQSFENTENETLFGISRIEFYDFLYTLCKSYSVLNLNVHNCLLTEVLLRCAQGKIS